MLLSGQGAARRLRMLQQLCRYAAEPVHAHIISCHGNKDMHNVWLLACQLGASLAKLQCN